MAHPVMVAVLIKVVLLLLCDSGAYELITPIVDDQEQIMKDAVDWLTLRHNGKLVATTETLSDEESKKLETLHTWLRERYTTDINFRAFLIAFKEVTQKKLTLKEGATCDPAYVDWYKNPHNNMVEWRSIKRFVFKSYQKINDPTVQFCDFREGLVCQKSKSGNTHECGCRDGAEMSPIKTGSSVKRCLLRKEAICAIQDLESRGVVQQFITEMIWNPERPEGCQKGLQCRFKYINYESPQCFSGNHAWYSGEYSSGIGSSCSLGNALDGHGQCSPFHFVGIERDDVALVCYNFQPPGTFTREGHCAYPRGPYQVRRFWPGFPYKDYDLWATNFVMGFVTRSSVHYSVFSDSQLDNYYEDYLKDVYPKIFPSKDSTQVSKMSEEGGTCRVKNTEDMLKVWEFYEKLSYTENDLKYYLIKMEGLVASWSKGNFCRVYWSYSRFPAPVKELPPLKCDPISPGGDEGKCVANPGDITSRAFARKVQDLSDYMWQVESESNEKEENKIYETAAKNPVCTEFQIGKPCPSDEYLCFKDYRDQNGLYDKDCNLLREPDPIPLCRSVHEDWDKWCEKIQLERMVTELLAPGSTKVRGDLCDPDLEKEVRHLLTGRRNWFNDYARFKRMGSFSYCDRTRFLTCDKSTEKCVCFPGTSPRSVEIGGEVYKSDYCYVEDGSCKDVGRFKYTENLSDREMEAIKAHYGEPGDNCEGGNFCVFVDAETKQCTTRETGNTGFDGPEPTIATPGPEGQGSGIGSLGGLQPPRSGASSTLGYLVGPAIQTLFAVLGCILL